MNKSSKAIIEFIEPELIQSKFFSELSAEDREYYTPFFASLRWATRQWLALSLLRYRHSGGVITPEENRNSFVQSLFEQFVAHEDIRMSDEADDVKSWFGLKPFDLHKHLFRS